jgi:hypothetical protein
LGTLRTVFFFRVVALLPDLDGADFMGKGIWVGVPFAVVFLLVADRLSLAVFLALADRFFLGVFVVDFLLDFLAFVVWARVCLATALVPASTASVAGGPCLAGSM